MDTSKPLVSVFIVTYNSSDYIIEALESVRNQTYQNIELVVSDDCSSDDTITKVREWIDQNKDRFIRTEVVETPVNTGIPANYNRAVRACKGEWLKMMDGDDLLLPNCVEDNVNFVSKNPESHIVFSDMYMFKGSDRKILLGSRFNKKRKSFFEMTNQEQTRWLLKSNVLPSQTCFISSNILKNNSYDENYRLLEDYPMWLNLSKQGYMFFYFDKCTAMYRLNDSVSSNKTDLFPFSYTECCKRFFLEVKLPLMKQYRAQEAYCFNRKFFLWFDVSNWLLKNKRNIFTMPIYGILWLIIFKCCYFRL